MGSFKECFRPRRCPPRFTKEVDAQLAFVEAGPADHAIEPQNIESLPFGVWDTVQETPSEEAAIKFLVSLPFLTSRNEKFIS